MSARCNEVWEECDRSHCKRQRACSDRAACAPAPSASASASVRAARPSPYRLFDGMCWPAPSPYLRETDYALRYDTIAMGEMKSRLLVAASVIEAYQELIALPERARNAVIRELRKGPSGSGVTAASTE